MCFAVRLESLFRVCFKNLWLRVFELALGPTPTGLLVKYKVSGLGLDLGFVRSRSWKGGLGLGWPGLGLGLGLGWSGLGLGLGLGL